MIVCSPSLSNFPIKQTFYGQEHLPTLSAVKDRLWKFRLPRVLVDNDERHRTRTLSRYRTLNFIRIGKQQIQKRYRTRTTDIWHVTKKWYAYIDVTMRCMSTLKIGFWDSFRISWPFSLMESVFSRVVRWFHDKQPHHQYIYIYVYNTYVIHSIDDREIRHKQFQVC